VWAFTAGRHRYAVPDGERDQTIHHLSRRDFDLIRWEYEIDAEQPDWPGRDHGFVAAHNVLPMGGAATAWQRAHQHEAGLFPVRDLRQLTDLTLCTLSDSEGNVNLYGLADLARKDRLLEALRGRTRPEPASLLAPGDVFVDITIGCDLGDHDSLLVVAPGDRRRHWQEIIDEYRGRVHAYEEAVGSFRTVEDLFSALDALQRPVGGDSGIEAGERR
ncbi:hypothetical protein JYK22_19250, partial [Nonomuraea sp. RK-328]|nr:hypothetical protein [Nonomuraea sp. RK-328]